MPAMPTRAGPQPVLLPVGRDGLAQRLDQRVDVALQFRDLALGLHRDGAGQIPGQLVHVLRQPLPGAGDHLGLSAERSFIADLADHLGHLGRERQLVDHGFDCGVDRGLELDAFPAGFGEVGQVGLAFLGSDPASRAAWSQTVRSFSSRAAARWAAVSDTAVMGWLVSRSS
jgi:hypothetical protein